MPIMTSVESRSRYGRCLHVGAFALLALAGITMLYPFLLMISGSVRSEIDENNLDLVPAYFTNSNALYKKFQEYKYQQRIRDYNQAHLHKAYNFEGIPIPPEKNKAALGDFKQFWSESDLPYHWKILGGVSGSRTIPKNLRTLREHLSYEYGDDFIRFGREAGIVVDSWRQVVFPKPNWPSPTYDQPVGPLNDAYVALMSKRPIAEIQLVSISGYFLEVMVYPNFSDVNDFNQEVGTDYASFNDFRLPSSLPTGKPEALQLLWVDFVRDNLNASFVILPSNLKEKYADFLQTRYGSIDSLNDIWGTNYIDFKTIALPKGNYLQGSQREDYAVFLRHCDPKSYRLTGPEFAWKQWLAEKYGANTKANGVPHEGANALPEFYQSVALLESGYVDENKTKLRWQFATRNFINVFDAAIADGRAFRNTFIFCGLSVLMTLLVNPIAAYGLSRFKLPGSYKILLFLMAVMAFPPMVTTIPVFLMMQELHLMNTFAGLILPTVANGYFIFLLKGTFDAIPEELYEAATIDGASETRIFFTISVALSKPILAVVALSEFNTAYTAFLYAIIIAPSEDMWLLPVWLYQYQETVSTSGVFASVLLASIPPLLIFLFAQRIILRGIVVPVEK